MPSEKSENDKMAENLHAIIQKETREKEERQRAQRAHRAGAEAAVNASIEALAGLDEIIAQDQENPAEYLANRPRISVPAGQLQRSKNRTVFDKGLPSIDDLYFREMKRVYDWDSRRFAEECSKDVCTERFNQTAVTLAMLQEHKRVGQKLCFVSGNELTMAENTDSLHSITGGDITEVLPSIGFWFKRRILNTPSHFLLVSVFRKTREKNVVEYKYQLTDRDTEHDTLQLQFPLGEGQECVGGLSVTDFSGGAPRGPGKMQTTAVPLITNMSIWDAYMSLLPKESHQRMLELYEGSGKVASGESELFMLKCVNQLRVVISCMGIMSSAPEYIGTRVVQERTFPKDSANRNERRKGKVSNYTIMELRNPVPEDPPVADSSGEAVGTRRVHWRRGHFVRKPHGVGWELSHPDHKVIMFPDGRRAHQIWIKPTIVRSKKERVEK